MSWTAAGPFDTERDARAVSHEWSQVAVSPTDNEAWREARRAAKQRRMHEALERTGTPTGAYDGRIAVWVAEWNATVEVLAALIERAYEAGLRDARVDRAAQED